MSGQEIGLAPIAMRMSLHPRLLASAATLPNLMVRLACEYAASEDAYCIGFERPDVELLIGTLVSGGGRDPY